MSQVPIPLLQVTPIFGMYFLQAELTINECSRRGNGQRGELKILPE